MSARDTAAAVLSGAAHPREAVEIALDAAAALNPALNALTVIDADGARAQADALAGRLKRGERPPLAGAPLIVKDNIWVEGLRITQGSRLFADFVAPQDAIAVARARTAGAIVIGIGACSEFACKGQTETPLHGVTRNPADLSRTPGGSSGGCAAAVGARIAPLALGTDAGGSSRRPPAHCGVVGFKPSLGAIPYGPSFAEAGWDISSVCPITRDVGDAAALFEALAGPDPFDAASFLALEVARPVDTLRIGWAPTFGLDVPVDADVAALTAGAVARLRAAGFAIADMAPDWPEGLGETAIMPLQHAGLAALHGAAWRADPGRFDPDIGAQIDSGLALSGTDVARALDASLAIRRTLGAFFARCDLLLTPTTPCPAWPVGQRGPETIGGLPARPRGHAAFTPLVNHARAPAISIPCASTADGLPLGLQIVAGVGRDRTLLAAAAAFEAALAEGA
jgi:aspartyl-tRNA(Asn)/glutamyl-tRNA(Gln) amidotransferase subunit A